MFGSGPAEAGGGQIAAIVSAVGVAIMGAASSYFAYQKKKLCFKLQGGQDPESGKGYNDHQSNPQSDPQDGNIDAENRSNPAYSLAGQAFVTLATTDSYCMGATVVGKSLRRHGTTRSIAVMVTPNVSEQSRLALENVFDEVITVDVMDSEDRLHLSLLGRPELGVTFTKIHCWTLTQYSKCVFLDADTLVLCNVDELFERDELSAAPDPGWPDCFNSGVFVFRPSLRTHASILDHALRHGSFDGGDQGLLNSFFSSWPLEDISKHLSFVYNLSGSSFYSYLPAFQQFGHNAKIVHFLGAMKPWSSGGQKGDSHSHIMERFVSLWWKEYLSHSTSSSPPGEQFGQDSEKAQQIQKREAKMPFRETLDGSNSLLPHFSTPPERLHSPSEPETCSHADTTPLEEKSRTPEETEIQDTPLGAEGVEVSGDASDTGTHPQKAADPETDRLEHRRLWEAGKVDYMGRDAFDNIQRMLDRFLDL
ncbi:Glycogenin-1 [Collichthys lucidus]|uniref:glycogenin glucosyltransferase n=1 Tax=Collichthys lucidus TaxID=240159 RepID=A0A4U5TZ09_COLLU|nr:Glycogenin-1 [Collichthys lucidus]